MSDSKHDEEVHHSGPIKTSKQLLLTVLLAFVVPVFVIIGLVTYVVSDHKPSGSSAAESQALGGTTPQDRERGVAERIRKVGTVEIADTAAVAAASAGASANPGEALYKQTCVNCHGAGLAGSPKFGDKAAWAPRIQQGVATLVENAIKGKNAMPARGGSSASDADMKAAVEYMVNASK